MIYKCIIINLIKNYFFQCFCWFSNSNASALASIIHASVSATYALILCLFNIISSFLNSNLRFFLTDRILSNQPPIGHLIGNWLATDSFNLIPIRQPDWNHIGIPIGTWLLHIWYPIFNWLLTNCYLIDTWYPQILIAWLMVNWWSIYGQLWSIYGQLWLIYG
jgi:hypothetical protein